MHPIHNLLRLSMGCLFLSACDENKLIWSTDTASPVTSDTDTGPDADADADSPPDDGEDTNPSDTSSTDTATVDTGSSDTGSSDTGSADTGTTDTGSADTGLSDTGFSDTGGASSAEPDTDCLWSVRDESVYLFCGDSVNWTDAYGACLMDGFALVSIDDEAEQLWIMEAAASFSSELGSSRWWIGANDIRDEGVFTWVDRSPVIYTAWADEEPNDWGTGEDCTELMSSSGALVSWNDLSCSTGRTYICEEESSER